VPRLSPHTVQRARRTVPPHFTFPPSMRAGIKPGELQQCVLHGTADTAARVCAVSPRAGQRDAATCEWAGVGRATGRRRNCRGRSQRRGRGRSQLTGGESLPHARVCVCVRGICMLFFRTTPPLGFRTRARAETGPQPRARESRTAGAVHAAAALAPEPAPPVVAPATRQSQRRYSKILVFEDVSEDIGGF